MAERATVDYSEEKTNLKKGLGEKESPPVGWRSTGVFRIPPESCRFVRRRHRRFLAELRFGGRRRAFRAAAAHSIGVRGCFAIGNLVARWTGIPVVRMLEEEEEKPTRKPKSELFSGAQSNDIKNFPP